jgi:hypothetical protein
MGRRLILPNWTRKSITKPPASATVVGQRVPDPTNRKERSPARLRELETARVELVKESDEMNDSKQAELERAQARIAHLEAELDGAFAVIGYAALQAGELRVPQSALMERYQVSAQEDIATLERLFKARVQP